MKLISMTDFVLSHEKKGMQNTDRHLRFGSILRYAHFLKQPLTLGMFVPCDEDGNVLDCEPVNLGMMKGNFSDIYLRDNYIYGQAKERVLFEGFDIKDGLSITDENSILHPFWNYDGVWEISKGLKTIEDLIPYNLTLNNVKL